MSRIAVIFTLLLTVLSYSCDNCLNEDEIRTRVVIDGTEFISPWVSYRKEGALFVRTCHIFRPSSPIVTLVLKSPDELFDSYNAVLTFSLEDCLQFRSRGSGRIIRFTSEEYPNVGKDGDFKVQFSKDCEDRNIDFDVLFERNR